MVEITKQFVDEVAQGKVPGWSGISKFGKAGDIDTGDDFVDVWDGAENANADKTYTFSSTADIDSLSSSDDGDTEPIEVEGLDTDFNSVTQTITLTGQTRVALTTSLIRVFRMKNMGTTDLAGDAYCYVNGAITAGVPDTSGDIRAIINNGNNQTLMAIYTVPNGQTGYVISWFGAIASRIVGVSEVQLMFREFGSVFQLKHVSSLLSTSTSHIKHPFTPLLVIPAKTDVILRADSSANNNAVAGGFEIVLEAD